MKSFFLPLLSVLLIMAAPAWALSARTCNPNIPKTIKYRPKYSACGGKAAVLLSGKYYNAFSVVLKKVDHSDRLANGCPYVACSPFKTQKVIKDGTTRVNCFGASGASKVMNGFDPDLGFNPSFFAKWISIKVTNSHKLKDVEIYCLPKPYPRTKAN